MPLPFVVDTLDDVPEAVREHYTEQGGKYRLTVDGAEPAEDVKGLKTALERERAARKELAAKAKALPEDFDVEEWTALRAEKAEREEKKAKDAGEFEKLRDTLRTQHEKDLAKREEKISALNRSLQAALIGGEATRAIAEAKGSVKLLLPHVERHAALVEQEDGSHVVRIRDPKGEGYRMNGDGEYLTIEGLVAEMRETEDFGGAFAASGATGGGASGGKAAGGGTSSKPANKMTPAEKAEFIEKHGIAGWYQHIGADIAAAPSR